MKIRNIRLLIKSLFKGYTEEWESLCHNCGACCYEKTEDDNGIIYIDFDSPCSYLDADNDRCSIYGNRFKLNKHCSRLGVRHALFARWLPPDCGYIEKFRK